MLPLHIRPGDEWLVVCEDPEIGIMLRADVGAELSLPPLNGWKFLIYDYSSLKYVEDLNLTCRVPLALPSCTLKVSLYGQAEKAQGFCNGHYKTTGLTSMGRQVNNSLLASYR